MIFAILLTGLSGMAAQVVLLRELLVSFYGNELALGLILGNWIILEAAGVFFIGLLGERIKNKTALFLPLQLIFSLSLPAAIYFTRAFRGLFAIPFGEASGIRLIFLVSLIVLLPVAFCHGGLFALFCKIFSPNGKNHVSGIGRVYALETLGTIVGGVALTYLFIPYLSSFRIILLISFANIAICFFFLKWISRRLRCIFLSLFLLFAALSFSKVSGYLENTALKGQWQNKEVLDYRASLYGNLAVIREAGQYTFYYNGLPVITAPCPDLNFVQEFGNLPLLFHPGPEDILVVSGGAGGLIGEILKGPVSRVYYAELDPLLITLLKKYPTGLTSRELYDARTRVINQDGRYFIKNTRLKFDCIIIGMAAQADLTANRHFSKEFFFLLRGKLKPGGIITLWLPGSLSYLSAELRDLNACIINSLKENFTYVRIIPGDYNIILASETEDLSQVTPEIIYTRMRERGIGAAILTPAYLDYKLSKGWAGWFEAALGKAPKIKNEDLRPQAVYLLFKYANKKFSPALAGMLEFLGAVSLRGILFTIFLLAAVIFLFSFRKRDSNLPVFYGIATTGFFGMLANLILIFAFQVFCGYLYYKIGLLLAVFMAGAASGSIAMSAEERPAKRGLALFLGLESATVIFAILLAGLIQRLSACGGGAGLIFMVLFFISGALTGMEFPLAARLCQGTGREISSAAAGLYSVDLLGGWVAGIFGGLILIPVLGVAGACMAAAALKLGSLIILVFTKLI